MTISFRGRRIKSAIILILISDPPSPDIRRLTLRMSRFRPIKSAAFTYCFRSGWSATTMSGLSTFCDERADGQGCRQTADQCRKSAWFGGITAGAFVALRLVSLMIGGGFDESIHKKRVSSALSFSDAVFFFTYIGVCRGTEAICLRQCSFINEG